ncbi:hypothetical protein CRUP_034073 [Coryphaenoides rupestris]|nr:hypothetical protein CRUP_034073 [Coryphaenoides rupestris]
MVTILDAESSRHLSVIVGVFWVRGFKDVQSLLRVSVLAAKIPGCLSKKNSLALVVGTESVSEPTWVSAGSASQARRVPGRVLRVLLILPPPPRRRLMLLLLLLLLNPWAADDTRIATTVLDPGHVLNIPRSVSHEDSRLDRGSIGHSFIRVDALVQFSAVEEVLQELLDLGDSCGAANEDDVLDLALVQLGISQGFLNRLQRSPKELRVELFKAGPCNGEP